MLYWTILIILICVFYMIHSTKRNRDFQIIQTPLRSLTDTMLHEKYPILVHDYIEDVAPIVKTVFRFQYLFLSKPIVEEAVVTQVRTRFLLVHNETDSEAEVHIGLDQSTLIPITLDSKNLLILPAGWTVEIADLHSFSLLALNDLSHRLFFAH